MARQHDPAELAERLSTALATTPGASAAALATSLGLARSTTAKALVALESTGHLVREQGGRDGARRLAYRWYVAGVGHGAGVAAASGRAGAEQAERGLASAGLASAEKAATGQAEDGRAGAADAEAGRLRRGALSGLVLKVLGAHAGDPLGPVTIARTLGRSSGAVSNALVRLEASGDVEEVGASPRRYRATSR